MSEPSIEFESTVNGWRVTIAPATPALISELAALEPKGSQPERSSQVLTRIMRQLEAVLRTATRIELPPDGRLSSQTLTADLVTLEEAAHILQALTTDQVNDPDARLFWLKDERILSFSSRGMGQMQLGALLAYAKRLENMRR